MYAIFDVNTGQVAIKRGELTLRAIAIGSCIVVAAYDPKTQNAGMSHIMLSGQAPEGACEKNRYALNSIEHLLNQMTESGSRLRDIEVCLVGAGNVLRKKDDTICLNNIQSVTAILAAKNIPVRASVLGGFERKSVFLETWTGRIFYSQGDGSIRLLWQSKDTINPNLQSLNKSTQFETRSI